MLHPWSWSSALQPLARLRRRRAVRPFLTSPRHELDAVGNHLVLAPFLAVLPFPTAPLEASLNERGTAFTQELARRFSLATEGDNIHKADFFPTLGVALFVAALPRALRVYCQPKSDNRSPTGCIAQLGIAREIAKQDNFVEACHTPGLCAELSRTGYSLSSSSVSSSASVIVTAASKARPLPLTRPSSLGPRRG